MSVASALADIQNALLTAAEVLEAHTAALKELQDAKTVNPALWQTVNESSENLVQKIEKSVNSLREFVQEVKNEW